MYIYAVTCGEYDDYEILALTANKEKAEKLEKIYKEEYGACQIVRTETFEDNDGDDLNIFWRVSYTLWFGKEDLEANIDNRENQERFKKKGINNWTAIVRANSKEEAIEKAKSLSIKANLAKR